MLHAFFISPMHATYFAHLNPPDLSIIVFSGAQEYDEIWKQRQIEKHKNKNYITGSIHYKLMLIPLCIKKLNLTLSSPKQTVEPHNTTALIQVFLCTGSYIMKSESIDTKILCDYKHHTTKLSYTVRNFTECSFVVM